jgi:hypothetical protein
MCYRINTWINVLDLCSFVQVDFLRMALLCRNTKEFDNYHELRFMIYIYFILLSAFVGQYIVILS